MLYIWHLTVPADTAETAKTEEKHPIRNGVVTKISVSMEEGCRGMVKATLSHQLTQLMPFNNDGYVALDGPPPEEGMYFWEVSEPKPELILRGWSPDTDHSHDVTFRVNVLPRELAAPYLILRGFVDVLKRLIGLP